MLIAVVSDSHNNNRAINEVKSYIEDVDVLLFLGDGEADIKEFKKNFKGSMYAVKGNCDISNANPSELLVDILGKKIFMCHGHKYNVKNEYNTIYYKGLECGADVVLFGHSHIGLSEKVNDIILMNPGSVSHGAGMAKRSLGFIEILENGEIVTRIKELRNGKL